MNPAIALAPIQFPEIGEFDPTLHFASEEAISIYNLISVPAYTVPAYTNFDGTLYVYEELESRLWLLGTQEALVAYFSFETGKPFCYHVESLYRKSRVSPFSASQALWHTTLSVATPLPASNKVLPEKDGYPILLEKLDKSKLIPSSTRKILKQTYCQMVFTKLGFPEPTRTCEEVLRFLIANTADLALSTVLKLHPAYYEALVVEKEIAHAKAHPVEKKDWSEDQTETSTVQSSAPAAQ